MGWERDDLGLAGNHEGYMVGLIKDGFGWRELGGCDDYSRQLDMVQVGCECGWRSPRMSVPLGAAWVPCCVVFDHESYEDAAADLWGAHIDEVLAQGMPRLRLSLWPPR